MSQKQFCKRKHFLDDWSLKTKLYILFIFCVLVPVLATNTVFYQSIKGNIEEKEHNRFNEMQQRIRFNLRNSIDNSLYVSNFLYTDVTLNRFMESRYRDDEDYYLAYYDMLSNNNLVRYYYSYQQVNQVTFYVGNDTFVNGGNFIKLDDAVRASEWYQALMNTSDHIMIYSYFDKQQAEMSQSQGGRKVSIIRRLDYFGEQQVEKVLKVDLDYAFINKSLKNEGTNGNVYVVSDDKVIFSNDSKMNKTRQPFHLLANSPISPVQSTESLPVVSENWQIIISADKLDFLSEVIDSKLNVTVLMILNLLMPTLLIWMISRSLVTRIDRISKHLDQVKHEQFEVISGPAGKDEIGSLTHSYNMMVIKIRNLIEIVFKGQVERQALELSRKQAELKALQSQVNPHFMFNTLETIRMRSLIKDELETSDIIHKLALLLRQTINWGDDLITIAEEIKFVESYLNIQQYRFGEKLQFAIKFSDASIPDIMIPKLTVLTFVENACIHGIESTSSDGIVEVLFEIRSEQLSITIRDTGVGIDPDKLALLRAMMRDPNIDRMSELSSIGMMNAYIRLRMYFDDCVQMDIFSEKGKGTTVAIHIPLLQASQG
ncbi:MULTISPECIES: sensor histidine kinase [Paenibacillus]|uniref:histidine kinase n=1 Tax=Paenibacillus pabuli TaxID=1472 RepID=A0A855Y190_9BACL|nr:MULTISPECIES: sensor histidine kinase [Paenibacillus]PWW34669.1 two-component system sensor histidine kinase YesM [Paenibacillus pabuli]PXW01557.1 two-component system sensor histidine kinase YesM [Paenibacillus taichungensis]